MSRYKVKSADGEISFESLLDLEKAWLNGLVEPDDEVFEPGATKGKKAGSMMLLQQASAHRQRDKSQGHSFLLILSIGLSGLAYWFYSVEKPVWAMGVAFAVASLLFHVSLNAFKRKT